MRFLASFAIAAAVAFSAEARVVINEVMYHAPADLDGLEYVELFNSGAEAVDLSGWGFQKGIKYRFPNGTKIGAKGFLVIAHDAKLLNQFYQAQAAGTFTQHLKNSGEKLELVDGLGAVVDVVHFKDRAPWPMGADGNSGSLERIDPESPGDNPANWASSPLSPDRRKPMGSPMQPNAAHAAHLPPVISEVKASLNDPAPGQAVQVNATITHGKELKEVVLLYRLAGPGYEKPEAAAPMQKNSESHYSGSIPGQGKDQLVRYRIRATDADGVVRFYPAETEPRPALSFYAHEAVKPGKIPFAWIITTTAAESKNRRQEEQRFGPWAQDNRGHPVPPFKSAFVAYDPAKKKTEVFDFVQVKPRKGGRKVHFYNDQLFDDMKGINLIFEYDERFPLTESMAYEVYRRAGMPAEKSYHMRTWVNGQPIGYQLLVEQPNRGFLRRNNIRDDGNMYKLLWYHQGLVGQHEKKTNTREGHEDLIALMRQIDATHDREQWEVIKKNFDVPEVVNYFAVNTVLSYWDGYFNNYFTYHDAKGTGKWTMIPWDQDKTWGIIDGGGQPFVTMPLTFGMKGDKPPGTFRAPSQFDGNQQWWRPPGWFSGPLLANPYFRKIYLTRVRELVDTVYTEKNFYPLIDDMGARLSDDVRYRAELMGENPTRAMQRLEGHLNWMKEHLKKRREFLLAQKELQSVAKPE